MAEEGKRVEVRMGTFACTIEGYDDPISKLKEVMSLVQHMISETPALVDVSADVDHDDIQDAMDAEAPPVRIRKDPPQDETTAPPDDAPASETDGDFILASDDGHADEIAVHEDSHMTPDGDAWAETRSPEPEATDDTTADADVSDAATPADTADGAETRLASGSPEWTTAPPSFDSPGEVIAEDIPVPNTPEPASGEPDTSPVESAAFTPPPTPPARRPRPSDTRAGRRLYGMGRFAAGVAGGKRTAPTTVPPMEDATPEEADEAPPPDAYFTPDTSADGAYDDANIFADAPELLHEIETSSAVPSEDPDQRVGVFEPEPAAAGTEDDSSLEQTVPDASDMNVFDTGHGVHADEDGEPRISDIPDDAYAVQPQDTSAATNLTPPFQTLPEEPVAEDTLPLSEPVADAPEHIERETAPEHEEPRRAGSIFRSLFGSRSRSAKDTEGGNAEGEATAPGQIDAAPEPEIWTEPAERAIDGPERPAGDRDTAAPHETPPKDPQEMPVSDSPPGHEEPEPEIFNIFASAPDAGDDLSPTPDLAAEAPPAAEPVTETDTSHDRVDALLNRLQTARDEEEAAPRMSAPGEAKEDGAVPPEAAGVTAADLVRLSGAETVADLLAASAAWLTLTKGKLRFSRRDVMDVFDGLPGEHSKTLEARIKGYGKLVRSGTLVLIGDGQFALAQSDRERFAGLIT